MARKISISGTEQRRQLRDLRRLSPDVSAKLVAPKAQQENPFGKAIGNVMAYSIVGDLIDRSTDFDLNWVLLQISTTRMIAAMMSLEGMAEGGCEGIFGYEERAERGHQGLHSGGGIGQQKCGEIDRGLHVFSPMFTNIMYSMLKSGIQLLYQTAIPLINSSRGP